MALKDEPRSKICVPGPERPFDNPTIKDKCATAAVTTKTRPWRTGKHHGPKGRTESKIRVPGAGTSLLKSYKNIKISTFSKAASWLLAAAAPLNASAAAGTSLLKSYNKR